MANSRRGKKDDEADALSGAYETFDRGAPLQYERVHIARPFVSMLE
jgi:hypothetical protein